MFGLITSLATTALGGGDTSGGGIVSTIGTALGSIFGGHGAPDHEASDRGRIAAANGITDQQAADVCANEERKVKDNYDTIVKRAANDNSYFLTLLAKYNQDNPNNKVVLNSYWPNVYQPSPGVTIGTSVTQAVPVATSAQTYLPQTVTQAIPQSTSQQFSSGDIKNILTGAANGAVDGATNAALQTPEGQKAKNEGAKQWVNENGLYIGLGLSVVIGIITWLSTRAFSKR